MKMTEEKTKPQETAKEATEIKAVEKPQPQTQALEKIANHLITQGRAGIKRALHQAAFLATIEAASETLGQKVTPTPLYRISYEGQSNKLEFKFLNGRGQVPSQNSVDIDYADLAYASFACDRIALLSEGITGTGKTYTLDQVLKTVYSPDNIRGIRLNASMSNVLQPYIIGRVDPKEGLLRININRKAVRQIAALFIDEQNRGDTNAVLGLLDNQVILSTGESAELGLLIPQIKVNGNKITIEYEEQKIKPIAVHSAQNPPDPEYTGARRTDGAVGNRQVRINYPNMALHSGAATLNMTGQLNHHHERFMDAFTSKLAGYLRMKPAEIKQLLLPQNSTPKEKIRANQEYLNLHASAFDPENARNLFLKSAVEGADHIIMLTGTLDAQDNLSAARGTLEDNFKSEQEISEEWTKTLNSIKDKKDPTKNMYAVNFAYNTTIDKNSQTLVRIENVRSAFNESLIERDKTKATKIADALSLITRYKQAYMNAKENETSPLEEFIKLESPLTVRDVAASYSIVLSDKIQSKNGASPISVVNQAFADYTSLLSDFWKKVFPKEKDTFKFNIKDPSQSIRYVVAIYTVNQVIKDKGLTPDQYAQKLISGINTAGNTLRNLDDGSDTKKLLIARINADIASFAGFAHQYRREIAKALDKIAPGDSNLIEKYNALAEVVRNARNEVKTNYTLPRVERIFGI